MTISNDRIRRVAEKHVELRVKCFHCNGIGEGKGDHPTLGWVGNFKCEMCAATGWTPLPVHDWADALLAGGHFKRVVVDNMILADGTKVVEVFVVTIPNISVIRTYYADNEEDALVMALEQADGVKE